MVKKLLFCFLFVLLAATVVSAATEINVKTLPNHKIKVYVQRANPPVSILEGGSLSATADAKGLATLTFPGGQDEARINAKVTFDGEEIVHKIFEEVEMGKPIYLHLLSGEEASLGFEPFEQDCGSEHLGSCTTESDCTGAEGFWYDSNCNAEAKVIEAEVEEVPEESEASITGFAILDTIKENTKTVIYYAVGAIAVLAMLIFVFKMRKRAPGAKLTSSKGDDDGHDSALIADLESKIKEAQKELNMIKNESKVKAAEAKLKKDQEELEKLRRGE